MSGQVQFVAYDGEAIDDRYAVLQDSTGQSLYCPEGIATEKALEWLYTRRGALHEGAVRVFFGLDYDVQNIVRDLPDTLLVSLCDGRAVDWQGWRLRYNPGRLFSVARDGRHACVFYDLRGFFESSFVEALEAVGLYATGVVQEGKAKRGTFTAEDLAFVREYNLQECTLLVKLAERLRDCFERLEMLDELNSWHGIGALATVLLKRWGAAEHVRRTGEYQVPLEVRHAWRCAYFGGRIESLVLGTIPGPIFEYDLNAAYPMAMRWLPGMGTEWTYLRAREFLSLNEMSVWHVKWRFPLSSSLPFGPLPYRDADGAVLYPRSGEGWYWQDEVLAAMRYAGQGTVKVLEGWACTDSEGLPLMHGIESAYHHRLVLEGADPFAAAVMKRSMAATYGKLAQQAGQAWWRCLPWAGMTTAMVRAQLLDMASAAPWDVLAFMTDALLTTSALHPPMQTTGGGWKESAWAEAQLLESGVYRLRGLAGQKLASRGFRLAAFPWESVLDDLTRQGYAQLYDDLFVTLPLALTLPEYFGDKRLQFIRHMRTFNPAATAKLDYQFLLRPQMDWRQEERRGEMLARVGESAEISRRPPKEVYLERLRLDAALARTLV